MWRWAFALALLCAAFARSNALKRAEMSAAPFILTSRYGRSPPRMIEPRNDSTVQRREPIKRSSCED
ncbi:unnamed protein product [Parnassius apollo]|uniref:(apollo) hypothetical protein n=1 Tax=Parnassius apollo TaxID=110799 RepID=A0A8S3X6F1_PARAO|nr:unnamed protein product [Parnassius apollo]